IASWPDMNTALPATLMHENVGMLLAFIIKSAMPPPQPRVSLSEPPVCHSFCWLAWENNLGGSGTLRALYSASVGGWTRLPMLSMMPRWPASKIGFNGASWGASARVRALGSATEGLRAVAASCSRGVARVCRIVLYAL